MTKCKSIVRMLAVVCVIAVFSTACTAQERQNVSQKQTREHQLLNEQGSLVIPMTLIGDEYFVSAKEWIDSLEYNATQNGNELSIGYTDELFQFTADSKKAKIGEQEVNLNQAPIWHHEQLWFPASVLKQAFQNEAQFEVRQNQIILRPNPENLNLNPFQEDAAGSDRSADDFFAEENEQLSTEPKPQHESGNGLQMQSESPSRMQAQSKNTNVNVDRLLARARDYLGVPYEFGASPYANSKRFDCSSFVQHVYRPFGIDFPRTARSQAKKGTTVSRQNLRKGDLLYFNVPGRFNSSRTIGHVGIYIGNGNMIHSSPAPKDGVQITSIHKKYWKDTFITAKRVL